MELIITAILWIYKISIPSLALMMLGIWIWNLYHKKEIAQKMTRVHGAWAVRRAFAR